MTPIALIKRIFVRQTTDQNCGLACLKMIFTCYNQVPLIDCDLPGPNEALSLAQMKKICVQASFPARAVEMDMDTLISVNKPLILHTRNEYGLDHFIVCFSCRKIKGKLYFLIADPAQQVTYLTLDEINRIWISKAALYFENEPNFKSDNYPSPWKLLQGIRAFPLILIPVFGLLSMIAAAFGVGLTWLLQRGQIYNNLMQGTRMVSLIVLLVIIYFARALANYLKQFLLIRINIGMNAKMMQAIISRLFIKPQQYKGQSYNISNTLADIQRVQAAISAFIAGLCCDGTFIFAMLGAIFYMMPYAGMIDLVCLIISLIYIYRFSSKYSFEMAKLNDFSRKAESSLKDVSGLRTQISNQQMSDEIAGQQLDNFRRTMGYAEIHGMKTARLTLWLEILQTLNMAIIFFTCYQTFNNGGTSYDTLMIVVILSYIMSSLLPKILNALTVLAEGADAAIQINTVYGN
ncbi:cysteine peptidase family C39 domain-containing protein [Mucilaginibacter sp. P25]|uniref:Peptidase C39 family protein n=2 Tax=Mucilaginibacter TaxID=423349 RepID=A0A1H8AU26_9SPHI|nr:cysteine peptidase family C39 domain-containing protein [Mucilaginibacter gossypiicola]SEM74252.1 Peptidase C39 family protein [Mucilaginibacter gossypiicola]